MAPHTQLNSFLKFALFFRLDLIGSIRPIPSIEKQTTPKNSPKYYSLLMCVLELLPSSKNLTVLYVETENTQVMMKKVEMRLVATKIPILLTRANGILSKKAMMWIATSFWLKLTYPMLTNANFMNLTAKITLAIPVEKIIQLFSHLTMNCQNLETVSLASPSKLNSSTKFLDVAYFYLQ
jgi:hypothetical protein